MVHTSESESSSASAFSSVSPSLAQQTISSFKSLSSDSSSVSFPSLSFPSSTFKPSISPNTLHLKSLTLSTELPSSDSHCKRLNDFYAVTLRYQGFKRFDDNNFVVIKAEALKVLRTSERLKAPRNAVATKVELRRELSVQQGGWTRAGSWKERCGRGNIRKGCCVR
eukprot:TRINITY_DN5069_c0_g1_i4.p1 TRINITY_DN5069_c0_g1~~TRINITY_DN5069_c0_g1_i4.p1  ORF type:complete len:167 (+),score=7.71 TRINITY_DN5069_c0_g1_i4:151-651(+)